MDALKQSQKLIERSQNILIIPSSPSAQQIQGDSLASALALFFTLKKLGKNTSILIKKIPEKFQFLINLQPAFSSKEFVISIDGSEKEISEMRYEKNEKGLKIYLTLNKGEVSEKDVSCLAFGQNPDLLITLGIRSAEDFTSYEAAILNIDNQPSNEDFGEINLIEITSSLAEISTNLIKSMGSGQDLIDENIATCLLTGIIYASQNFRSPKTRPQAFEASAYLIEKGADHQKIIQHLYKQKNVPQIRILGRILEKLSFDEKKELYCTSLTERDFQECGARPKDLSYAIEELKFNFHYLPNLLILWESHTSPILIKGIIYSTKPELVEKVLENYQGVSRGEIALFLIRDSNLASAKEKMLKVI